MAHDNGSDRHAGFRQFQRRFSFRRSKPGFEQIRCSMFQAQRRWLPTLSFQPPENVLNGPWAFRHRRDHDQHGSVIENIRLRIAPIVPENDVTPTLPVKF